MSKLILDGYRAHMVGMTLMQWPCTYLRNLSPLSFSFSSLSLLFSSIVEKPGELLTWIPANESIDVCFHTRGRRQKTVISIFPSRKLKES